MMSGWAAQVRVIGTVIILLPYYGDIVIVITGPYSQQTGKIMAAKFTLSVCLAVLCVGGLRQMWS